MKENVGRRIKIFSDTMMKKKQNKTPKLETVAEIKQ